MAAAGGGRGWEAWQDGGAPCRLLPTPAVPAMPRCTASLPHAARPRTRRLPAARASKAETDLDFRAMMHSLVKDLLAVSHQPAWPAASFLLLRLAAMLAGDKGLRHSDAHVRQYCVDLLASLAAALYRDEAAVQANLPALRQLAAGTAAEARGAGAFVHDGC